MDKWNIKRWNKRLMRLWLIVLLPISFFTAYKTYTAYQDLQYWEERERAIDFFLKQGEPKSIFDRLVPIRIGESQDAMEIYFLATILILFSPLIINLIILIINFLVSVSVWIWSGNSSVFEKYSIKEKTMWIRGTLFLLGSSVIIVFMKTALLILKDYGGIQIGGAIPELILIGLPIYYLGDKLYIWKKRNVSKEQSDVGSWTEQDK